jgi:hypothetical protein
LGSTCRLGQVLALQARKRPEAGPAFQPAGGTPSASTRGTGDH